MANFLLPSRFWRFMCSTFMHAIFIFPVWGSNIAGENSHPQYWDPMALFVVFARPLGLQTASLQCQNMIRR